MEQLPAFGPSEAVGAVSMTGRVVAVILIHHLVDVVVGLAKVDVAVDP